MSKFDSTNLKMSGSSSSSDEEDEHLKQLKEAIDPTFSNDSVFEESSKKPKETKTKEPTKNLKSERYLESDDGNENSLFVTASMQNHFYKKLSQAIENIVDFVDESDDSVVKRKKKKKSMSGGGVKLLREFDEYLKDPDDVVDEMPVIQKKPKIKRKHVNGEVLVDDVAKIQESVVQDDEIETNFDTKHWKTPPNREKVIRYREKNAIFYLQEPENEFTKQRKKNNWDECKISRNYNKKKSTKLGKT